NGDAALFLNVGVGVGQMLGVVFGVKQQADDAVLAGVVFGDHSQCSWADLPAERILTQLDVVFAVHRGVFSLVNADQVAQAVKDGRADAVHVLDLLDDGERPVRVAIG